MKKIISILLAVVLLVSAVPTVFAAETVDYTVGTLVTYTANANEAYTITVPAVLSPGTGGTVTLEGTWPSDRIVSVTADKNVKLTNSISGADYKTLDVSFPGIAEAGSNSTSQKFTETVSVAGIADALFGTWSGRFYYNVDVYGAVEYLQSKYQFEYYSTMNLAVTDVNNGAIGTNADVDKEDAVAGIYTDENGGVNVVLLQDTTITTRIKPSVDMTINLGGNTLSSDDKVAIATMAGNITIDGRLSGSAIEVARTDGNTARPLQVEYTSNVTVNGGTYIGNSAGAKSACIATYDSANLTITDAIIRAAETDGVTHAIQVGADTTANITNCDLIVTAADGKIYGIESAGTATVSNCNIEACSNYTYGYENYYSSYSVGISNTSDGTLTINDCYVMGTHSGVSNHGTLYVNGGTYEGFGHGGFYFAGSDNTAYVREAIICQCAMPDGYAQDASCNGAGFYIGGATGNDNISVYMDNCDIYGSSSQIVLRGSANEQNNSLYISNSSVYDMDGDTISIRIDNNTHKLYIGAGNNFTADNTTLAEAVTQTEDIYIMN